MKYLDARINYSSFGNWVSIDKIPDEISFLPLYGLYAILGV